MGEEVTLAKNRFSVDYLRGLRHGIEAGARVAYGHDRGRSYGCGEISTEILDLKQNIVATAHVIKKVLNRKTDSIPIALEPLVAPPKKG